MRRSRALPLVTAALFAGMFSIPASSAAAYTHHCGKFAGTDPSITYRYYDVGSTWNVAFSNAQSAWDVTSAAGVFTYAPSDGDPMVSVNDGSYADGWWATTSWVCSLASYLGNEVDIYFDTVTTAELTTYGRKLVAEHELGHAYGLDHTSVTCDSVLKAVMQPGGNKFTCSGTPPWPDDVNGVNAKY